MKHNGNDKRISDYYIGIDAGTNSVGFAVTDTDYNLCRFKGNSMWGVRLFDEAKTSEQRRIFRTNRRRLSRRKQRLELLYLLFKNELDKVDANFDKRLKESSLISDEKTLGTNFSLFADKSYTDKDYMKEYKTIYHLRKRLINSKEPVDIRLVYLAIHHILKSRGHFLFDIDSELNEKQGFTEIFEEFKNITCENMGIEVDCQNIELLHSILSNKAKTRNDKKKELKSILYVYSITDETEEISSKQSESYIKLILGLSVKASDLFNNTELKGNLSANSDFEGTEEFLNNISDEQLSVIFAAKKVYDFIKLEEILGSYTYISDFMISKYNEHNNDIQSLKKFLREVNRKDIYKKIFLDKKQKLNNYAAYSGYKKANSEHNCNQEEFCSFLKKELNEYEKQIPHIFIKINEGTFAPKPRSSDNGVIPNSLHRKELEIILENASDYLPFLNLKDVDGMTISDKIFSLFDFKIPYYVGPLNNASRNHWVIRNNGYENEKIYPWNFEKIVDLGASAEQFIIRMTGKCNYTGLEALPMDSLLYREFTVLNEINSIKINGKPITKKVKDLIYNELFMQSSKKVTKNAIHQLLCDNGEIEESDEISGVDTTLTTSLSSYHKLKQISEKVNNVTLIEELIRRITIFGQDKKLLKIWIKNNIKNLSEKDIQYLLKVKFEGWGKYSKEFLNEIFYVNPDTSEAMSVMDLLRENSENLMQILYNYGFISKIEDLNQSKRNEAESLESILEEMYISPMTRRSIRQTLKIIDEIVDIKKSAPKKIFIEMARDVKGKNEKKRSDSRKEKLIELYKACGEDHGEIFDNLLKEDNSNLRRDKLYLYYTQFGHCMYSEEVIPLEELGDNGKWDIDHIYPRSQIKDDSINNRVLVKATLNRTKTNEYPIKTAWRKDRKDFWTKLLKQGMISKEKYDRLVRSYALTEEELSQFVHRQMNVTTQSTKALTELLQKLYPNSKIVYSKAGNISDFRKYYGYRNENPYTELVKCREINDLHHAKDAYLNIVVGNFYDTKFTEAFFKNIENEKYSLNPEAMFNHAVPGAWVPESKDNSTGTIQTVRKMMKKNNVICTRMPRVEHGQLYKVTILKKTKGQIPIKTNKSIEKYGGYDSAKGAYYVLVEQGTAKKRTRSIETILIYQQKEYEDSPISFFEKQGFINPKVIVPKIPFDALIELNGIRYNIKGRSDIRILYDHTSQLIIDNDVIIYIKKIYKYIERCLTAKKELTITSFDDITADKNMWVYDIFTHKAESVEAYKSLFGDYLSKNRIAFSDKSIYEQCNFIIETLKGFNCDSRTPNYTNRIRKPKKLNGFTTAYLINQSVTGLYETKIDLLHEE